MRDLGHRGIRTVLCVALAIGPAGCGGSINGSATPSAPAPARVAAQSEIRGTLVYVADSANSLIDVFDVRGALQYTITSGLEKPAGLFVDASGNLWVANPGANNVLEFHRGAKAPSEILHDTNLPNDVALCSDGTAFVADSLNGADVGVYPPGHTEPARRLVAQQSGQGGNAYYVTCDKSGNVFATGIIGASPYTATIGWRHAKESGYYILNQKAWSSAGVKATSNGALLIAFGSGTTGYVQEFTENGRPAGRKVSTSPNIWGDVALNSNESVVFGTDPMHSVVAGLTFPGDKVKRTYSNGNLTQPDGVAVDPGD